MLKRMLALTLTLLIPFTLAAGVRKATSDKPNHLQEIVMGMLDVAILQGANGRMLVLILFGADVNGKIGPRWVCGNATAEETAKDYDRPLNVAAWSGNDKATKVLLGFGADVNGVDGYGRSALWHAALGGHESTVRLLISRGANVNPHENDSQQERSPLGIAIAEKETAIVELLLANGARP